MNRVDFPRSPRAPSRAAGGAGAGEESRSGPIDAVVLFVLVAAGHALGTVIVSRLSHVPSIGVTFFPASGVTVAALLLVPRRLWPTVLAATFAGEFASHVVLGEAVVNWFGLSFSDTVSPAVGAWLVLRVVGGTPRLSRRADLAAFVGGAVVGGPLVGSLIGPEIARLNAVHGSHLATMARWGTGDSLGVLIVGGLLLSWFTETDWPVRPRFALAEAIVLGAAVLVVTWLAFWVWTLSPEYLIIPLLGWAALRFGTRGAMTATAAVTALAEWATVDGHRSFATLAQGREADLWLLQLFLAVVVLTALVLASQVAELAVALSSAEASEEQYRCIFEATSDGLIINDPASGAVVEVNPAFCQMHGFTREELIGTHPTRFIHPADHSLFADYIDAVGHGLAFRVRARDVTKDGRVFDVEIRGSQLPFRGAPHVLGVVRDVSEEAATYRLLEERVTDRTRELSGLLGVAGRLAGVVQTEEIPAVLAEEAARVIARSLFSVWQLRDSHLVRVGSDIAPVPLDRLPRSAPALTAGAVVRCRGANVDPDLYVELAGAGILPPGAEGVLSVPLVGAGDLLGMLVVARCEAPRYDPEEVAAAQALGTHVAVAMASTALFERAQALAAGEARQGLARDLHDSVSQTLFSMTLHARAAQGALRSAGLADDSPAAVALDEVAGLTRGALAEMRALIFELRPGALAKEGLVAAVSKHAGALSAREGLQVDVVGPADRLRVGGGAEEQLYRLIQEALYNVVKHAGTDAASVVIASDGSETSVTVRDEGVGFDPYVEHPGHVGLASMRERVARLGGRLTLASSLGVGTTVTVSIPFVDSDASGDPE